MEILQKILSEMVCSTYALESMIYLTAGLADVYDNQDVELESTIIKVFSQQTLMKIAISGLNFMGPRSLIEGQPMELYLRNAIQLVYSSEALNALTLIIGLTGLQHTGMYIHDIVKKVRNPLFNPSFIIKRLFENTNIENPKSTLNLNHHLHQSLDHPSHWLEHSIIRLKIATETLLGRHGAEIFNKQIEVERLSEAAVYIYAMFASLARSSRSYCIGLQHADDEMVIAAAFCYDAMKLIKNRVTDIHLGTNFVPDSYNVRIGKQLFNSKGYFPVHPLTRNF